VAHLEENVGAANIEINNQEMRDLENARVQG
jgi:hypothetical protein